MSRHILGQFHKIVPSQFRLVLFCEGIFGCGHFEGFWGVILSADGFESLPICYCCLVGSTDGTYHLLSIIPTMAGTV